MKREKSYTQKLLLLTSILLGSTFIPLNANAEEETKKEENNWKFKGQVFTRGEFDGRDFTNQTSPLTYTLLRTRLSAEKTFFDKLDFMIQIQDSRVFGEAETTIANLKN